MRTLGEKLFNPSLWKFRWLIVPIYLLSAYSISLFFADPGQSPFSTYSVAGMFAAGVTGTVVNSYKGKKWGFAAGTLTYLVHLALIVTLSRPRVRNVTALAGLSTLVVLFATALLLAKVLQNSGLSVESETPAK